MIKKSKKTLVDASSWWECRDRIFNIDPNNPTRNNLDEVFNNW